MVTRILDTNVLLDRPLSEVVESFEPCIVVIPFVVTQELDTFKVSDKDILRTNSRAASRYIDSIRKLGNLQDGVNLESGHTIRIELGFAHTAFPDEINDLDTNDYKILKVALGLQRLGNDVVVVSQDINVRILADTLGLFAESYGVKDYSGSLYQGWRTLVLSDAEFNAFSATRKHYISSPCLLDDVCDNEYFILTNEIRPKQSMLGRFTGEYIEAFIPCEAPVFGIRPLNVQQKFLLNLLMNPDIKVVTSVGGAGSGKTLLSLAAAMDQTKCVGNSSLYNRIVVARSPIPVGKDIGFLPGTETEKVIPWLASIRDNMEVLLGSCGLHKDGHNLTIDDTISMFLSNHTVELKSLTYMRGRSLLNQFVIIEEAQNLTVDEIKTVVSRVGKNTKMVLIGDVEQIDNIKLNATTNGLVHLVDCFRGLPWYGHVTLTMTERSEVADAAVRLL